MATFIKDLFSVGSSKVLIIFAGIGISIITARYIGPEGNGIIAGLTVYPSLFMSIGSLGIRQSTAYFLGKGIYSEENIKTAITQIWFFSALLSLVVCYVLMRYFSSSGGNLLWVSLALLPIPFSLFNTYNSGIFLGNNNIRTFNRINWIPAVISLLSSAILVMVLDLGVSGAMAASIGGTLFMFLVLLFKNKFVEAFSFQIKWGIVKSMLSLGIVYAISLLVINLNYKVDIIILDRLSTPFEMGIYSKGSAIIQYLWQIPMLFSTVVFARSAVSKDEVGFSHKVAHLLRLSFLAIGLASVMLIFFSKWIIVGMYGEHFRGSISVLNFLLPGVLILTIFKVMNMDLAGKGKPWIAMQAMLPALVVNIGLNITFIPKYGANGAALASTISYSLGGILFLWLYSMAVKIPVKDILTYKKTDFDPLKTLISKFIKR